MELELRIVLLCSSGLWLRFVNTHTYSCMESVESVDVEVDTKRGDEVMPAWVTPGHVLRYRISRMGERRQTFMRGTT